MKLKKDGESITAKRWAAAYILDQIGCFTCAPNERDEDLDYLTERQMDEFCRHMNKLLEPLERRLRKIDRWKK